MKKILTASMILLFLLNFWVTSLANAQSDKVVFLANKKDYSHAWGLAGFIQKNEIRLIRAMPENFKKYKNDKHIIILLGPNSREGMEYFFKEILSQEEKDFLSKPGSKKMYYKEDIWAPDQKVIIFGFSDSSQIKPVLKKNRRQWIEYLIDWFDLEISWIELEY